MNELDKMVANISPISPPLSEFEQVALKAKVVAKIRRKKSVRFAFLIAAMLSLVACGVLSIGYFNTMTETNNTSALIEKYGTIFSNPQSATVDNHTITVQAVVRSDSIARVIFDISGNKKETLNYRFFKNKDDVTIMRLQFLANGQPSGHSDLIPGEDGLGYNLTRTSGIVGSVTESNSTRYFADVDLPKDASSISLYVLSQSGGAEVIQIALPNAIKNVSTTVNQANIHFKLSNEELDCTMESVTVTPFKVILKGKYSGQKQEYFETPMNWSDIIKLYNTDGKQILIGKNGTFCGESSRIGSGENPKFIVELGSYDIIDPAAVAEIEIDGVRYPVD